MEWRGGGELMVVDKGWGGESIIKEREKGNLCLEAMNSLNCLGA